MQNDSWSDGLMTPEKKLRDVLTATFVIRPALLTAETRLVEDLQIDGDDASLLFLALSTETQTDFSTLYENWGLHFRSADEVARDDLNKVGLIALAILLAIIATWSHDKAATTLLAIGGFLAPSRRKPISLKQIELAIERRFWV